MITVLVDGEGLMTGPVVMMMVIIVEIVRVVGSVYDADDLVWVFPAVPGLAVLDAWGHVMLASTAAEAAASLFDHHRRTPLVRGMHVRQHPALVFLLVESVHGFELTEVPSLGVVAVVSSTALLRDESPFIRGAAMVVADKGQAFASRFIPAPGTTLLNLDAAEDSGENHLSVRLNEDSFPSEGSK